MGIYCGKCGSDNHENARVCASCGEPFAQVRGGTPVNAGGTLAFSIVVTLLCCLPFGIPGIVFAAQAMSKNSNGDYAAARRNISTAKTWCWVAFFCGLLPILAYLVLMMLGLAVGIAGAAGGGGP